jgi:hypothetical protein
MGATVLPQYVPDFLQKLLQRHCFAGEIGDEVARRPCRGAETQPAEQIE